MNNNALAFTALCNEFCAAAENCSSVSAREFVLTMIKLLPRIYITATDIPDDESPMGYIDSALDESSYDTVRASIASLMGSEDTYLEVFEEDMKYSETPIGTSVSENLSDLFQVFYNFLETVRDAPDQVAQEALCAVKEDFCTYWAQILCNVLRALNKIYYTADFDSED